MLQSSVWSQLARLKYCSPVGGQRILTGRHLMGPMSLLVETLSEELELLKHTNKHWMFKGERSIAAAAALLLQSKVIAVPTDTIYGLAAIASDTRAIQKLYEIKNRDEGKPLSICVSNVDHIKEWGIVDHLPPNLLPDMLPGPFTVILKRTPALNPALNPNHDTVGIRVPKHHFLTLVNEVVGPLALTSANVSNEPSCLYASEFENLWPMLDGIFHDCVTYGKAKNSLRRGSTIIDLTEPFQYKIVRSGVGVKQLIQFLELYNFKRNSD